MEDRSMPHDELIPAEQQALARERMQDRIRAGTGDDTSPGAMLEEIMEGEIIEEEMTEHLSADYREQTPGRCGERNGCYTKHAALPTRRSSRRLGASNSSRCLATGKALSSPRSSSATCRTIVRST